MTVIDDMDPLPRYRISANASASVAEIVTPRSKPDSAKTSLTAPAGGVWHIALTTVVEAADTIDGGHTYRALKHPAARPDFHNGEGFAIEIPASLNPTRP